MTGYRGRFAPSPTGALHAGHARTFLVAWLRARHAGGSIVMRMEDLDPPRVIAGAADAILRDMEWLGLDWDEGGARGGPHVPYVQSERHALYEHALADLVARGLAYPCTCSRREIGSLATAPHGADELGPRYPGTCRNGPSHPSRPAAIRFRMDDEPASFTDAVHGAVDARAWGGDFVIRRADGLFSYQLAVVVDDAAMGVTEVVRGDDLLASTPRQIALHRALAHTPPEWLHVPLVRGPDGERLSKRAEAASIAERRANGESAEQVVGELTASLGLVPPGTSATPAAIAASLAGRAFPELAPGPSPIERRGSRDL